MPNISQQQIPTNIRELVQSINIQVSGSSQFRRFQRMYYNDRIAFVYDCIPDIVKTQYLLEILGYYDEGISRVAVRGPHGLGKTTTAAILTHHSVLTSEEDCKVPTTASAWRQLEKYLWPEIKKIAKLLDWSRIGREPYDPMRELLSLSIRLNQGTVEAFAIASDDHNTIEGAHGTRLVYIFDEAKTIPRATWNAAEGAFANADLNIVRSNADVLKEIIGEDEYKDESVEESIPGSSYIAGNTHKAYGGTLSSIGLLGDSGGDIDSVDAVRSVSSVDGAIGENVIGENLLGSQEYSPPPPLPPSSENSGSSTNSGFNRTSRRSRKIRKSRKSSDLHTDDLNQIPSAHSKNRNTHHPMNIFIPDTTDIVTFQALAFAISTPGDPSGQFYDIHMHKPGFEHWRTRHVTVDEAISAGRISASWVEQMRRQWGEDSSIFQNRVLGEFADVSDEGIIPLSWVRAAVQRWYEWDRAGRKDPGSPRCAGVDPARMGGDRTVICLRNALVLTNLYSFSKLSTTATAGNVTRYCSGRATTIEMDGGLGASIYDMLRDDGFPGQLRPVTVSAPTSFRDKSKELQFENIRAAMWWNMRELLDPEYGAEVCLPPVEELILDLSTPKWEMKRGAVVQLEAKKSIVSRLGRSPDYGSACCLAFWKASSGGGVVF